MFPVFVADDAGDALLLERAAWQRRHLRRLDQARADCPAGWDSARTRWAAFGRLDMPELPDVYDAAGLLGLPDRGGEVESRKVRLPSALRVQGEGASAAVARAGRGLASAGPAELERRGRRRARLIGTPRAADGLESVRRK